MRRKQNYEPRIPANRQCERCRKRWAQHGLRRDGKLMKLCRKCERETASKKTRPMTTMEREQAAVERRLAREPEPRRAAMTLQPYRPIVVDGQAFDVVWDGQLRVEGGA